MPVFGTIAQRSIAATFHNAECSIYPPRVESGTDGAGRVTYTRPAARYAAVPCHVQPLVGRRKTDEGGADIVNNEIEVKVAAFAAPLVEPGDSIDIDTSDDPALTDTELVVDRIETRSAAITRRIICVYPEAITRP